MREMGRARPGCDELTIPRQRVLHARVRIGERIGIRVGQAQRIIQLAVGQQPGIGGDRRAAKIEAADDGRNRASANPDPLHPSGPRLLPSLDLPQDAEFYIEITLNALKIAASSDETRC